MPEPKAIIQTIIERAAGENWSREELLEAVWDAAVEWVGDLVDSFPQRAGV